MLARFALGAFLMLATSACAPRWPNQRLSRADAALCVARGGYESRSAFGAPICQFRYADAAKICASDSDCLGQCLDQRPGGVDRPIGSPATGLCEAEHYTPGCYAVIDGSKVVKAMCVD